jgi:23S rRNA pseudouridine2605 synthase
MTNKLPEDGERIAKFLSRAGVASRREVERMIDAGRVTLNGQPLTTPAVKVSEKDDITVDGKPIAEKQPAKLWLYNKPLGLVTSDRDEKGRKTVYDALPDTLPRVMSVGRLDLNSEGLLLLTNDGELKRKLELPSTGWVRKYRVRVKGEPSETGLDPLRKGVAVEGERFQPMQISIDRQQGANAWLTIAIREGKNREIRRALAFIGLTVNRLIRVSYGPFQLNTLSTGEVEEVRSKILRDQLGIAPPASHAVKKSSRKVTRKPRNAPPTGSKPKRR